MGENTSQDRDPIIVIGGSAGGIAALNEMLDDLSAPLAAPVIIALHSEPRSRLSEVLSHGRTLPIERVADGVTPVAGVIYVVPGGRHAYARDGRLFLSEIVSDSGFRPSIDMLFMTLAAQYGPRVISVVLSGMLQDGMRGAQVIYDMGGRTIVQDPSEAAYDSMPASVIRADHPKAVLTAAQISGWLMDTVGTLR